MTDTVKASCSSE